MDIRRSKKTHIKGFLTFGTWVSITNYVTIKNRLKIENLPPVIIFDIQNRLISKKVVFNSFNTVKVLQRKSVKLIHLLSVKT
jgi:hypothetical protein